MIIVILAAGKGNRLKKTLPKSFPYITKALIPINNKPAIKRLVEQISIIQESQIILVLGHEYKSILGALNNNQYEYVLNKDYENDSNLKSLFLAFKKIINYKLNKSNEGILIIEADSFFSNYQLEKFIKYIKTKNLIEKNNRKIIWTTKGLANKCHSGGFIDPLENIKQSNYGEIENIYLKKSRNNSKTLKMYGLTWLNYNALENWFKHAETFLDKKDHISKTGYFHEIFFKNLESYSMSYYDLGLEALSFNDYDEYSECIEYY